MFRSLATSKSGSFGEIRADQPGKRVALGSGGGWRRQQSGVSVSREKPGEVGRSQLFQSPQNRAYVHRGCAGMVVNTGAYFDCLGPTPNQQLF